MATSSAIAVKDASGASRRELHPVTWWVFGLAAAFLATTTTNLIQLLTHSLVCVALVLVLQRSAKALIQLRLFLILALGVVLIRVIFRIIFGTELNLLADISAGAGDGLRLAAIILSIAVANAMANPRKLLKYTPGALYEIAASISVALNLVPELIASLQRVRRASLIRGRSKGLRALKSIVIPVLEDSLERSMQLAASMSARGFGRRGSLSDRQILVSRGASFLALLCIILGTFLLLSTGLTSWLPLALIAASFGCAFAAIRITSRVALRTRYLPSRFEWPDVFLFALSLGLVVLGAVQ
jgi:energy-coupling factor transport system permease protein